MGVLICLRESGSVGMGAVFGGDVIQSFSDTIEEELPISLMVQAQEKDDLTWAEARVLLNEKPLSECKH